MQYGPRMAKSLVEMQARHVPAANPWQTCAVQCHAHGSATCATFRVVSSSYQIRHCTVLLLSLPNATPAGRTLPHSLL